MKRVLLSLSLMALVAAQNASAEENTPDCNRELGRTYDVIVVGVGPAELAHVELMMHRLLPEHRIMVVGHVNHGAHAPNPSVEHALSKLDVLMLEDMRRDFVLEMLKELPIEPIHLSRADYAFFTRERPGQTTWANQLRNQNRRHHIAFKLRSSTRN